MATRTSFAVDHRPLKPPVRTPKPRPEPKPAAPPPDPFEIGRIGLWSLINLDSTKKRALARCTACQTIREIALTDGVPSRGCSGSTRSGAQGFVEAVVAEERFIAAARHKGRR
jgi:hypothetical protein